MSSLRAHASRLGQNSATAYLVAPGYTTVDVTGKYRISDAVGMQLNVSNLTDAYCFDQLHPFHVIPGGWSHDAGLDSGN